MPAVRKSKEKYELIKQEVEICKRLASNDLKIRRKGISRLKKFLNNVDNETVLDAEDFARIWSGLFNYVWMSDKPLVQEADAETISSLVHEIKSYNLAMLFLRGFFDSIAVHWSRVSHYRTDKFLMFIRRFLRQTFILLKNLEWDTAKMEMFSAEMYSSIQILPFGLILHLNDIYNEEIAKVTRGNIPTSALILLLKCYVECIVSLKPCMYVINSINANIFASLVKQLKLYIQQKAAASLDSDEISSKDASEKNNDKVEENYQEKNENEDLVYDPRPGNVNVFLPYIEFDENIMAAFLEKYALEPRVPRKAKNVLFQIIQMVRSVKRLRESVNVAQTVTLQSEVQGKKKRKRTETLSILVKNSCKKLEKEMSILPIKKMRKLDRVLSTVASAPNIASTQTVTSVADTWTVTERIDSMEINNVEDTISAAVNTSQDWTITNLLIAEEDELLKNERVTVTEPDCNISQFESEEILNKSANKERDYSVLEDTKVTEPHPQRANNRKSRVSFASELVSCVTYEIDVNNSTTIDSKEIPVDVPLSAVKDRPGILKQDTNYSIVDFSSSCHAMNDVQEQNSKLFTSENIDSNVDEPVWKTSGSNKSSDKMVEEDVEISDTDYNISSLFETPPKKRYSRRSRNSIVVTEVKRSQRIANKIAAAKLASAKK